MSRVYLSHSSRDSIEALALKMWLERAEPQGLRAVGVAPDTFAWPPEGEPDRAPYRGWQPLEAVDASVCFGRDAEIDRALTAIGELRTSADRKLLVILGPSGVGKSWFLRAGVLSRLRRDDRHFLAEWWPIDCYVPEPFGKHLLRAQPRCAGRARSRVQTHPSASHGHARDRLRSAAHPALFVETGLRVWPRLRPTDRRGRG